MIEKIVTRGDDGGIERILERTLTPLEECVERLWPKVRHNLLQKDLVDVERVQVNLQNIPPAVDVYALAIALAQRVADEPVFARTTSRTLTFTVTPHTGARRE